MNSEGHKKLRQALLVPRLSTHSSKAGLILFLRRPGLHIAVLLLLSLFYSACTEKNISLIKKDYEAVYQKNGEVPVTYRTKQYEVNSEDITAIESTAGNKSYNPAGIEHYIYLSPGSSHYYGTGHNSGGEVK